MQYTIQIYYPIFNLARDDFHSETNAFVILAMRNTSLSSLLMSSTKEQTCYSNTENERPKRSLENGLDYGQMPR